MRPYICDPDKNKECKKTGCQDYCFHTFNKEYAREDLISLEETIKHCEEVAEEQEDFDKFQCGYWKPGCEDGAWKHTCRLPSNIPVGSSWGECSEQNCPLFHECLECANEHRQIAEWLRKLLKYESFADWIAEHIVDVEDWDENQGFYSEVICRKLTRLGHIKCVNEKYEYVDVNISANDIADVVEDWISNKEDGSGEG